jgi:hypothetical protein
MTDEEIADRYLTPAIRAWWDAHDRAVQQERKGTMTAQEIADRVVVADLTGLRFAKLEALCLRMKVPIADVIALLPAQARTQAEAHQA